MANAKLHTIRVELSDRQHAVFAKLAKHVEADLTVGDIVGALACRSFESGSGGDDPGYAHGVLSYHVLRFRSGKLDTDPSWPVNPDTSEPAGPQIDDEVTYNEEGAMKRIGLTERGQFRKAVRLLQIPFVRRGRGLIFRESDLRDAVVYCRAKQPRGKEAAS